MHRFIYFLLLCCFLLNSCQETQSAEITSTIELDINRTEALVFNESFGALSEKHPDFGKLYYAQIVPIKLDDDPQITQVQLQAFKTDPFILELKSKTDSVFADLTSVKQTLSYGLENALEAGIVDQIPSVYTFISGLSYQCFLFDDNEIEGLGIGLDMFLGEAFPYGQLAQQNPAFSAYNSRTFTKDHIAKKALETIVADRLGQAKGNAMIDHMIHNGKSLYILDQLLPALPDSIIHEYTMDQMDWCEQNQKEMWAHFLREDLFYETDFREFSKLVNPSPNSPGMPSEAPGRTANFIGSKIVAAYMDKNPDLSLTDLIQSSDSKEILDKSRYKPR